jgi:hypothetical protein
VSGLFDHLQGSLHELVMFDINRSAGLGPFIRASDAALVGRLVAGGARSYRRTLVTNVSADTLEVHTRTLEPGASVPVDHPLALAWPAQVFSLSHVALPFPADDPLYGVEASGADAGIIALGRLSPRGERAVLTVPVDTLMRIGWNPFYPYVADRIEAWVDEACRRAS